MNNLYSQEFEQKILKSLSDEEWQIYFKILKIIVSCSDDLPSCSYYDYKSDDICKQDYCLFIDSILSSLRSGNTDYCFHISQILDLLNFENERLRARWLPKYKCFKVYLQPLRNNPIN